MQKPQQGLGSVRIEQHDRNGNLLFSIEVPADSRRQLGVPENFPSVVEVPQMEHYAYLYSQAQQQNAVRMDEYYHELRQQELREPPGFWKTFWKAITTPLTPEQKERRRLDRKEQKRLRRGDGGGGSGGGGGGGDGGGCGGE